MAEQEQQGEQDGSQQGSPMDDRHKSVQIEEVLQQEVSNAQEGHDGHSSSQKSEGTGMMQSVMGAAKSLFGGGGKADEKVGQSR